MTQYGSLNFVVLIQMPSCSKFEDSVTFGYLETEFNMKDEPKFSMFKEPCHTGYGPNMHHCIQLSYPNLYKGTVQMTISDLKVEDPVIIKLLSLAILTDDVVDKICDLRA